MLLRDACVGMAIRVVDPAEAGSDVSRGQILIITGMDPRDQNQTGMCLSEYQNKLYTNAVLANNGWFINLEACESLDATKNTLMTVKEHTLSKNKRFKVEVRHNEDPKVYEEHKPNGKYSHDFIDYARYSELINEQARERAQALGELANPFTRGSRGISYRVDED